MVKSKWKIIFIRNSLLNNIISKKLNIKKTQINVWSRSSCITTSLTNTVCKIYNGVIYTKLHITKNKIGLKFGEFSFTRKPYFFPLKDKKNITRR